MAIARKPKKLSSASSASVDERKVMELIEKGGSIAANGEDKPKNQREIVQVFFRAPAEIIEKVEQAAKSRMIPTTRQNWFLEAIVEKLEKEAES